MLSLRSLLKLKKLKKTKLFSTLLYNKKKLPILEAFFMLDSF